jgi:hypothetical protein
MICSVQNPLAKTADSNKNAQTATSRNQKDPIYKKQPAVHNPVTTIFLC